MKPKLIGSLLGSAVVRFSVRRADGSFVLVAVFGGSRAAAARLLWLFRSARRAVPSSSAFLFAPPPSSRPLFRWLAARSCLVSVSCRAGGSRSFRLSAPYLMRISARFA